MKSLLGIGLGLQIFVAPVVFAQSGDIPSCAVSCYQSAVFFTGCATNDILCQCGPASQTSTIQDILTTCLTSACSSTDIILYQVWATSECAVASATATLKTATATAKPRTTTVAGSRATVTSSYTSPATTSAPKKKSYLGIIIGSVVGGLVLIGIICMAVIFCLWRRSKNKAKRRAEDAAGKPMMAHHNQAPGNLQPPSHLPYQVPLVGEHKIEDPRINSAMVSPVSPMDKFQGGQMRPQTVEMQGEGRRNDFVEMGPGEVRKAVGGVGQEPAEMGPGGR